MRPEVLYLTDIVEAADAIQRFVVCGVLEGEFVLKRVPGGDGKSVRHR